MYFAGLALTKKLKSISVTYHYTLRYNSLLGTFTIFVPLPLLTPEYAPAGTYMSMSLIIWARCVQMGAIFH